MKIKLKLNISTGLAVHTALKAGKGVPLCAQNCLSKFTDPNMYNECIQNNCSSEPSLPLILG